MKNTNSCKTVYVVTGITGLQAYSTTVVTDHIVNELEQLGWTCKKVTMHAKTPKRMLQGWFMQAWGRYIKYPRLCAEKIPPNSIVYVTDHSNAGIVPKLPNGCKTLIHMHDAVSMRPPWDFPYPVRLRNILIWLLSLTSKRRGLKLANKLVTVSKFSRTEIERYLKIPADSIALAYNGVDIDQHITTDQFICREQLGVPQNTPTILTIGPASLRKNYQIIASAITLLETEIETLTWLHIGTIEPTIIHNMSYCKNSKLFILKEIEFIETAYYACDILISASRYEGFGLPPLEALRCNRPVIVADIPVAREILQKHAGYFHPDKPEELATILSLTLKNNGVKADPLWAATYTWFNAASIIDKQLTALKPIN